MLNNKGMRGAVSGIIEPPARGLLRLGVSPDAVTVTGTIGVVVLSVTLIATGHFLWALLISLVFVPADLLDGTMARLSGRSGPYGAFLDSTLDRIGDGAVFGALAFWFASQGDLRTCGAAIAVLIGALTVSYAKARSEGLGYACDVGIAERTERLLVVALGMLLTGLGVTMALPIALWVLVILVWITVLQRMAHVRRVMRSEAS